MLEPLEAAGDSGPLAPAADIAYVGAVLANVKQAVGTALGRPRRWRFLERLPEDAVGAEIGVFRGEFTPHLLRVTRPRRLHLIDGWWTLYGERYPDWGVYTQRGRLTTRRAYDEARRAADERCSFHVGNDLDILRGFPEGHFDWVYLDTSHQYEHTVAELDLLRTRAKLICGDDWVEDQSSVNHGCSLAIRDFCARYKWTVDEIDSFGQWLIKPSAH